MVFNISIIWILSLLSCAEIFGYNLTLLHTNDVHGRVEQFTKYGTDCNAADADAGLCFGGLPRRKTRLNEIRSQHDNVLLVDAGDQFTGTLWFHHYRGIEVSFFMEKLGYDIMCLGNHEFDTGVEGLVNFLENVTFPVVSANTDIRVEPRLQGKFEKTKILTVGDEKIGVIGYITQETYLLSSGGPTVTFDDEVTTVQEEVIKLQNQSINKIIALGHAGFAMDLEIAKIEGVDIVVGGHTNTFLYNGEQPSNDVIQGPYPTIVTKGSGKKALVVQDFTWGKYLGNLQVTFDENGEITAFYGNPIILDATIAEDTEIKQYVKEWLQPIVEMKSEVIGSAAVFLNGSNGACRLYECNMGNLLTDAIIDYHRNFTHSNNTWAPAAIAVWNGGGIRASISKGNVTIGDARTVLPFGNEVDLITVTGSNLREQLENSVQNWDPVQQEGRFLQVSGLIVVYNLTQPVGQRVLEVHVRCLECSENYIHFMPLENLKEYKLFTSSFVIKGGDGYTFKPITHERFNTLESATLIKWFNSYSPVSSELENRIQFKNKPEVSSATSLVISSTYIAVLACLLILK